MLDWSQCPKVERSPEVVSGSWVFRDSRVPVEALFENLEAGADIGDFLAWFPGVGRKQVEAVLEYAAAVSFLGSWIIKRNTYKLIAVFLAYIDATHEPVVDATQ